MKEQKVVKKAVDETKKIVGSPLCIPNETIFHGQGRYVQVKILLTETQTRGMYQCYKRMGLKAHSLTQLAITEYLDRHLTDDEKEYIARPSMGKLRV